MLISERLGANKWYTATVQELFYEVCADRPEKEAIFYNGEFITYGTLQDQVNQLSQALINLGIGKGDRVAMLPSPTPDFVYLYYAVLQIGAVINPLNLLWGQIELSGILRRNDPKLIVTVDNYGGRDYIELLKNSITDLTIEGSTVSSKGIPSLKHMVACSKTQQKHEGFSDFHELLASGSGYDSDHLLRGIKESKPTDIQFICQTSGSTGLSKGALWDHRPPLGTVHFAGKGQNYTEDDRYINLAPFFHNSGLYAINLALTYYGSTLFLTDTFNPMEALPLIDKYDITTTLGFDAHFEALKKVAQATGHSFKVRKINGAIMSKTYDMIINDLMKVPEAEANLQKLYAQTENGPLVSLGEYDCMVYEINKYTNGRPAPGVEVVIKDIATGEKLPQGQQGEICYKSPFLFQGYYKQEDETKKAFDSEGYFHSSDFGTFDNGYITFLGRLGGVVKSGGENVSTNYVSALLLDLFPEEFEDVQTFGVPDTYWGTKVISLVRMKPDKTLMAFDDLKARCKGKMADYEIPKAVYSWEGPWPATAVGKIDVNLLQKEVEKLAGVNE